MQRRACGQTAARTPPSGNLAPAVDQAAPGTIASRRNQASIRPQVSRGTKRVAPQSHRTLSVDRGLPVCPHEPVPPSETEGEVRIRLFIAHRMVEVMHVRRDENAAGHVPGAINIPIAELEKRLNALPKQLEVVAYCRGTYCLMSGDAVALMRKNGYKARRLEAGVPEWRIAGKPIGHAWRGTPVARGSPRDFPASCRVQLRWQCNLHAAHSSSRRHVGMLLAPCLNCAQSAADRAQ